MDPFENWNENIDPRIDFLRSKGYHLEAFYLFSNAVEFILREAIFLQEEWISILIKKGNLSFKKTTSDFLDKKPLGALIILFGKYNKDQKLISSLNDFNSFRIKVIHKILKNDISKLNKEAASFHLKYNEIVSVLSRYILFLLSKKIKKLKREIRKREVISP